MPDTVKQGGARLSSFGGTIRETGMSAGTAAADKARILKEQLIKKEMGAKIMGFFSQKK